MAKHNPIDTMNDVQMINEGLRVPHIEPVDFTKSSQERQALKKAKFLANPEGLPKHKPTFLGFGFEGLYYVKSKFKQITE